MTKNIKQLFDEYMYECEFVQGLKPKTLHGYRQTFKLFLKLTPDVSLETLSTLTMVQFFKVLQQRQRVVGKGEIKTSVKKSTIATYWSKYNSFFEWLKIKGYITQNPLKELKRPSPKYDNKQYLKKEAIEKILTALITKADNGFLLKRNLLILYILLLCGLRRQELLLLQIRDIDLDKRLLTVRAETSKTPKTRYIPLHSLIIKALKEYLNARTKYTTPYLIVSSNHDAGLSTNGLKHLIATLCQASGVQFHVHQLRHTFAVNFLKSSNNVAKLQQLLGHSDPAMTLIYVRCLPPSEMRRDIEIMSLDTFL